MTIGTVLLTAVGLTGLWVTWFLLWKGYYLDKCRHELFALRGELFQAALSGEVEFTDPAYHMLRMLLNGMIRFNHRFNLTTLFLSGLVQAPEGHENLYTRWRLHVSNLAPESCQHLNQIYLRAHMEIMGYMARGSLLLRLVYLVYLLKAILSRSVNAIAIKTEMARDIKLDRLEREVYFSQEYECRLAAA